MKTNKKPKLQVIMLVFLLSGFFLNGQYSHLITTEKEKTTSETIQEGASVLQSFEENVLLEETIDPNKYIVGPGDEFAFNMLSSDGIITLPLKVSPTGEVLIPAVGVISVDKMILHDAFDYIQKRCLEKYSSAKINLTLVNIRKFRIQIYGEEETHFKQVSSISRVSDAVGAATRGGKLSNVDYLWSNKISKRNIFLHREGNIIHVDLVRFELLGDKDLNPYLREGDVIELSYILHDYRIVGGVRRPGNYEWVKGETIDDALKLAGRFTPNADSSKIEVYTFIDDTTEVKTILSINEEALKRAIHPEDLFIVRMKKDYHRRFLITISGEIKYPGVYSIKVGETTFGDIIRRAGGYATKADPLRIIINNSMISNIPDIELERISLISHEDRTDDEKSYIKARFRTKKGAIGSHSEKYTNDIKSFLLNDNDIIEIPRYFEYVEILGAVTNPGRYPFLSSVDVAQYIKMAGGLTETATRKIYIIKASTGLRLPLSRKVDVENGDIIFIAEKIEYNTWNRIQEIMTTLGQIATIIIVIQNAIGN